MRPRVAAELKRIGCPLTVDQFRSSLIAVKAQMFPGMSDEELCFTRYDADSYCRELRRRLGAPRMKRVFILRALVGARKSGGKPVAVTIPDPIHPA